MSYDTVMMQKKSSLPVNNNGIVMPDVSRLPVLAIFILPFATLFYIIQCSSWKCILKAMYFVSCCSMQEEGSD